MGLFSNLLKKAGSDLLKDVVKSAEKAVAGEVNKAVNGGRPQEASYPAQPAQNYREPVEDGPSGFSWGPYMPAEENQFNSGLSPAAYFEGIFRTEFADCTLEKLTRGKVTIFTFYRGGQKALVVELLSQSSSVYAMRKECARAGIPYLRYYYDHDGWWNTRAYVVSRTRSALGG